MSFARRTIRHTAVSPLLVLLLLAVAATQPLAQQQQQQVVPGSNVNMVSGTTFPDGDPYLQRQNEPSSAVSTRNPSHILGGSNDYRTVDLPGPLDPIRGEKMNADAWAGLFKSFDGGQTWKSTLLPGYPQDTSAEGMSSPIKGRHAATDAVVRAGTNGMFYYAGLAFDRGENAPSTIFVARYMDLNNLEAGDPIAYLDTRVVDQDAGTRFLDKTALATDIPRTTATCTFNVRTADGTVETQTIPAGNVYVAYTAFTGSGAALQSAILFSRSTDCGVTWSPAVTLSIGSRLVQNAQIAVSPNNGHVYVSWRRFRSGTQDDAVMVAKSTTGGATWGKPVRVAGIRPFDQGTTETSFRSNGFQTMAVDATGRAYLAWTERGFATLRPDPITGDARIVVSTSTTGSLWTVPRPISTAGLGHQLMPALTFHAGKLRLLYYDLREDVSQIFGPYVDELPVLVGPAPRIRHTIDVYVAQALPGAAPVFTSTRLSDYAFGYTPDGTDPVRLQFNPPNLPLFRMGTTPFMGDYIDLAPAPAFVQLPDGTWVHNTAPSPNAMGHAFWTDNRDVRAPADGDWTNYTPVTSSAVGAMSRFDPTQPVPPCVPGQVGMRNQNIYTARVSEGLFLTAPANNKPLGSIQRSFVVIAENTTPAIRSFRLTIDNQPPGGTASFLQFAALETLDVTVPPQSSIARTVFVTSSVETARVSVSLAEIAAPGDADVLPGGLSGSVVLNPDPEAPRIQNPRIQNPRIQNPLIVDAEAYNPGITNAVIAAPRIQNPRIQNPSIQNPRIQNPRIQNDGVATPRIQNDSVMNPGIINVGAENTGFENTGIANPRIQNPRIQNVDLTNAGFSDTSWEITNDGNTTSAYTVNLVLNGTLPAGFASQLLIHKTLFTPAARNCELAEQPHTILLANIPDPEFVPPADVANPRIQNPRIQNPTLALAPGETATLTLRIVDPNRFDGITFDASAAVTPASVAQAVNTQDVAAGIVTPRVALPLTITTADLEPTAPGTPYTRTLTAFGTTGPVTWTVQEGSLPPGMTLSPDGTLSGTPNAPGNYVFTVRSTDAAGNTDDQRLSMQVNPNVPPGFDSLWNGQDTDWSNPLNWSPRGVPDSTDRVYIAASVSTFPSLSRHVTVRDLFIEPGATLNTNGFTLTVTGNVDAGRTITGAGQTVVTGDGSIVAGVFADLEIRGRATLSAPLITTGRLILAAGSRLDLNGQPATLGGPLTTDVTEGAAPLVVGPSPVFVSTGVDVNGLVIRGAPLLVQDGTLSRFDNVRFDGFAPGQRQLTVRHPGRADAFDLHGVMFFLIGDPGSYVRAEDTDDGGPALILNFVNATPADGTDATATFGGAVVNWVFDPDAINLGVLQRVSPVPALAGSRLTYLITVSNGSAFAVEDVVLNPGVPIGAQGVTTEVSQGSCEVNSGGWTCNLGVIPEGQFAEVTVSYIWPTAGALVTTATVRVASDAIDALPANNAHTVVAMLLDPGTATNLSITKTDSADPAAVGSPFQYVLTVTNHAATAAENVIVTDLLPSGFTAASIVASAGSCTTVVGQVVCSLGTLAGGQSATVTITGTAAAAGILTNTASVVASGVELTPADNIATETTVVALVEGCSATFSGPLMYGDGFGPATFISAADMNHDGQNDLVVSHQTGNNPSISVLLNMGGGVFAPRIAAPLPFAGFVHAVADFNADTHPDVLQGVGSSPNSLRLLLGDGQGNLALSATSLTVSSGFIVVATDLDRDGDVDVVSRGIEGNLVWFANAGNATFGSPQNLYLGAVGASAAAADVNNDGWPDIVAAGSPNGLVLLLSDGTGGFGIRTSESTEALRVRGFADVNGDSRLDLLTGSGNSLQGSGRAFLAFGDGIGGFGNPIDVNAGSTVGPVAAADVNGDGRVDLVSTHSPINAIAVQLGTEAFGFAVPNQFAAPAFSNPVAADFNQDGRPDLAVADQEGRVRVFLNTCRQAPADLQLTVSEAADPVAEGDEIAYTMTVTNNGPSNAANVRLTFAPSTEASNAHLALDASSTSTFPGAVLSFDDRTGTWLVPSLPSGAFATFELRLRPFGGGTVTLSATVTHGGADNQPSNNSALETTTVTMMGRIILVTNTNEFGPGSFNQAIEESNSDAGDVDRIHFNIPGAGVHTIAPLRRLESISQPAIVDATTQPGYAGTPLIELSGANLTGGPVFGQNGLTITGVGGVTIRGFAINRFFTGIDAYAPGNTIQRNFIGTDVTGTIALGNVGQGITTRQNTLIGGPLPALGNVIAGNQNGIVMDGSVAGGSFGNVIQGNYIGTNVSGTAALPNGNGVFIGFGAANNTVGGTAAGAGNLISGNTQSGVSIQSNATGNLIAGNRIGTDSTGLLDLGNNQHGVFVDAPNNTIGGLTAGERNIISGNAQNGVQLHVNAGGNFVRGNYIGVRADGSVALGNGAYGVLIRGSGNTIGGQTTGAGNVISGNGLSGVWITPSGATVPSNNTVQGNLIGTSANGLSAVPNTTNGVGIADAPNNLIGSPGPGRNVISGNTQSGVVIGGAAATGNIVQGNYIGTDVTGSAAIPNLGVQGGIFINNAPVNFIGGANAGNVVSGNAQHGITVVGAGSTGNRIQGNLVGLAANGTTTLGNAGIGMDIVSAGATTIGGNSSLDRNHVAGNGGPGIQVRTGATGISILGNSIGANTNGDVAGNGGAGVFIQDASDVRVGDPASNLIVGNSTGVTVVGNSLRNRITGNQMHSNVGLAIDLNGDGPTANDQGDGDAGPNTLQNHPLLFATGVPGQLSVFLNSTPGQFFSVHLFQAPADCSALTRGTPLASLGGTAFSTMGNGNATVNVQANVGPVTAIAIDEAGNTSEFSPCVTPTAATADLSITKIDSTDPALVGVPFTYTVTAANAGPSSATNVVVTDTLPALLTAMAATSTRGSCSMSGSVVTCAVGTLAPAEQAIITITVTASGPGVVTNVATVTALQVDPSPANNSATEGTMVAGEGCSAATFSGPVAYTSAAGASSLVFLADMNHDGAADIVTGHHSPFGNNGAAVLLNDGTGAFGPRLPAGSTNATVLPTAVADFNNDTHPDVLLLEFIEQGNRLRLLLGDGTGALTPQAIFATISPSAFFAIAADLDADGDQDVLTRGTPGDLVVFRNSGTGSFSAPLSLFASAPTEDNPVVADFNGDNRPDIVIAGPGAAFTVLLANATGGYQPPITVATTLAPRIRAAVDANGDGDLDIAMVDGSSFQGTARLILRFGDGTGAFGPEVDVLAGGNVNWATFADVNGDGLVDIVTTHAARNTVAVQLGDGSGGFAVPVHFTTPSSSNAAVADINDDGRSDIVVGDISGTLRVLLNTCGQAPTDLRLTITESADPIAEGQELLYTVTLTNPGAAAAPNVTLTTIISNGGSTALNNAVVEATSSGGGTLASSGGLFTWTLDSIPARSDVIFQFRVTSHAARNLALTSTVTSGGRDVDASNNTVFETTVVTAAGLDLVVGNTNDSGPGSLRQAIQNSNADSGDVDRIVFNIPGSGPHTITLLTALPTISQRVVMDGTTQPGFGGTPVIELNGNGVVGNGLAITAGSSTIRGLAINRFTNRGISVTTSGNNLIEGNFLGTDPTGTVARPNSTGIFLGSPANVVGGTTAAARNVISGNTTQGVVIGGAGATGNIVSGNYIGLGADGTTAVANGSTGVSVDGASTIVGGGSAGSRNVIGSNGGAGVYLAPAAAGSAVRGNFIGTDATGALARPNNTGVGVHASNVVIGGSNSGEGNVISGNTGDGIGLWAPNTQFALPAANSNQVLGNLIGTTAQGTTALPNSNSGLYVGGSNNTIGGTAAGARNVISGNAVQGINIASAADSNANVVQGNFIGTDISGTAPIPNGGPGIGVHGSNNRIGGDTSGAGNVISGNVGAGIGLWNANPTFNLPPATNTTVAGNLIGTNAAGTAAVPNLREGIWIGGSSNLVGGTTPAARNVISGNGTVAARFPGVGIGGGTSNTVRGNYIGTNAAGTVALGNTLDGIFVNGGTGHTLGGTAAGEGNLISGNLVGVGLYNGTSLNVVQGNQIGTNAAGTASIANGAGINVGSSHGNTIGGAAAGAGNLISGNTGGNGIWINASNSNTVQGNRIGTNADGTGALPNGFGMFIMGEANLVGGTAAGAGNLISGNTNIGASVAAGATATVFKGNLIGTNAAGTGALPNGSHGLFLEGANTIVGGTEAGAGNVIAYNGVTGIRVNTGTGHTILGNSIRDNGDIGIDVGPFAVTANDAGDADAGANNIQNFPVLTSATTNGATTMLQGTLNSTANRTFRLEFFANTGCDPSSHGEGQTFAGSLDVTTDGAGNATFSTTVGAGAIFTATATDPDGNTSELSACVTATVGPASVSRVFVVHPGVGGAAGTVSIIDPDTNSVTSVLTVGMNAQDAALSPEGTRLYVTNFGSNTVSVIDLTTNQIIGTVTGASFPIGIRLSPDGTRAYVAGGGGTVFVVNTATLAVIASIPVGNSPNGLDISPDGSRVYVANRGTDNVSVISTTTNTVVATVPVGDFPVHIAVTPDGTRAYVSNVNSNNVSVIDTTTNTVVATVAVGTGPNGIGVTADGTQVYVSNFTTNTISRIDVATNRVIGTIAFTGSPYQMAMLGSNRAYVGAYNGAAVRVIDTTTNAILTSVVTVSGFPVGIAAGTAQVASGSANLAVTLTDAPDPAPFNSLVTLSASVTNSGPDPASHVVLAMQLPAGFTFVSAAGATCTASGSTVSCPLGDLGSGATAPVELTVRAIALGTLTTSARVHAAQADPQISNNLATVTTTVTAAATTFTVTNTFNSGAGSLRDAITLANTNVGTTDTIAFAIPGAGPHSIPVLTPLAINDPVIIDGTTQPGFSGSPLVELRGTATPDAVGLQIVSGNSTVRALVINGFTNGTGISMAGNGANTIAGNFIGTNVAGTAAVRNQFGILISSNNNMIGGTTAADRNVISGNVSGVRMSSGTGNIIQGNYIGLNAAGTSAVGNTSLGVDAFNGTQANRIGGTAPGAGNVISGSPTNIQLQNAPANTIVGNIIGLDPSGTTIIGSSVIGISLQAANDNTIGGTSAAARNVISGHTAFGIEIGNSARTVVEGNFIGTDATGTVARGNSIAIQIHASAPDSNRIGGTATEAANTIAFNANGIRVLAGVSNSFLGNSIHSNGLLGIDLNGDGVTANDPGDTDTGVNSRQNFPVLTSATTSGATTTVQGTLNSAANTTFRVEFFSNAACDPSGHGEGQAFVGWTNVTTDGGGNGSFMAVVGAATNVTATATHPGGSTSEFSQCFTPALGPATFTVTNTNDSGPGSLRQAILDANARSNTTDLIAFNLPQAPPPLTIAVTSQLPAITDPVVIDGFTQPGSDQTPVVEVSGANAPAGVRGFWITSGGTTLRGLTINSFTNGIGIYLDGGGNNLIIGNRIGTDWSGTLARPNILGLSVAGSSGNIIGGFTASERNVISANTGAGIDVSGTLSTSNLVVGNYIGLNALGTSAIPSGGSANGIRLASSSNVIGAAAAEGRNVISGFSNGSGIFVTLSASGNLIHGNYIGTNAEGSSNVGSSIGVLIAGSSNQIGSAQSGGGNLIAGNTTGISLTNSAGPGNTVVNNVIGLNAAGATVGNAVGIETTGRNTIIGGTDAFARNVISGNGVGLRVWFGADFTRVEGNTFGFSPAGDVRPNGLGIDLNSVNSVTIGGLAAGAGNTIANSTNAGVQLFSGNNNAIRNNSIFSNGGLGIDLTPVVGVTPNDQLDADTGTNDFQNFPTLTAAVADTTFTVVHGFLHSTPNSQFVVDFFTNTACDPSGNGEGQTFLGTRNLLTGANGTASFAASFPVVLPTTARVTSTALAISGGAQSSSEFSNCVAVTLSGGGFEAPVELFSSANLLTRTSGGQGRGARERTLAPDGGDEAVPPLVDAAAAAPLALLLLAGAVGASTRSRRSRWSEAVSVPTRNV